MYPVFCTANIPSKVLGLSFFPFLTCFRSNTCFLQILDEFIDEAYKGWIDLVDDPKMWAGAPCILQTTDLDSITHGSRKPTPDFESPFLNNTEDEIRDWMQKNRHPNFAEFTFTILDQNTVDHKICRMGYVGHTPSDTDTRMLSSEFYVDLYIRVPLEMCTVDWDDIQSTAAGGVYSRKVMEEEEEEVERS
jgi:hypothetical protein